MRWATSTGKFVIVQLSCWWLLQVSSHRHCPAAEGFSDFQYAKAEVSTSQPIQSGQFIWLLQHRQLWASGLCRRLLNYLLSLMSHSVETWQYIKVQDLIEAGGLHLVKLMGFVLPRWEHAQFTTNCNHYSLYFLWLLL